MVILVPIAEELDQHASDVFGMKTCMIGPESGAIHTLKDISPVNQTLRRIYRAKKVSTFFLKQFGYNNHLVS